MKNLVLIVLTGLLVSNCSVQKRKYQKGFYVNWKTSRALPDKKESLAKHQLPETNAAGLLEPVPPDAAKPKSVTHGLTASVDRKVNHEGSGSEQVIKTQDEPCDVIVFRDGTELNAKVIEISPKEIKYKKCDTPDGPLYITRKPNVFMIKYANGTKETFNPEKEPGQRDIFQSPSSNNHVGPKHSSSKATTALILGVLGLVIGIGSIPAIVLGDAALREIKANPDQLSGESEARIGLILGIIGIVLKILVVAMVLVALSTL